jgi:hypothetical protein
MSGSEGEHDLSGRWSGIYNYPSDFPPNSFEATIRDAGGVIAGLITQPREVFDLPGPSRQAVIEGRREGSEVTFVKYYDDDDLERGTPHYRGTIQAGGDEIAGEWSHPGEWSGTFLMIRAGRAAQAEERKVSEKA